MEKKIIDQIVDRFLAWPLPMDFSPDGRISFNPAPDAIGNEPTWPVGTNLLTAVQAKEMVEHIFDGVDWQKYDKKYIESLEKWADQLAAQLQVAVRPETYGTDAKDVTATADGMLDSYYSFMRRQQGGLIDESSFAQ